MAMYKMCFSGSLHATAAQLSDCRMAGKTESVYTPALYKKSFSTPTLNEIHIQVATEGFKNQWNY